MIIQYFGYLGEKIADSISWLTHQSQMKEPSLAGDERVLRAAETNLQEGIFGAEHTKHA